MSEHPTSPTAFSALFEKKQEPVKIFQYNCLCGRSMKFESEQGVIAPQREWIGLTDDEVEGYWDWEDFQTGAGRLTIFEMVRDIEAKLKQKNGFAEEKNNG
jgi:hypothetical protein